MLWLPTFFQLIASSEAFFDLAQLKPFFGVAEKPKTVKETKHNTDFIICGNVPKTCEDLEYRSYDGTCNNLNHSWWGAANMPYKRLFPNTYSDGVHAFPVSVTKRELPNVRTCSLRSFVDVKKSDPIWNLLFMQYGQIIAHDISLTAGVSQIRAERINCCQQGKLTLQGKINPQCAPIEIPADDPFNAPEGIKCMEFQRTLTSQDMKCTGGSTVAEPVSSVTAYLDLSVMYGSDNNTAKQVRLFEKGKLAYELRNGKAFLTQDPQPLRTCNVDNPKEACYLAGDMRVNQNPQLAILHNLFMVHHNEIAKALAEVNPHWDDEKLFQVTRKIVIAQYQHSVYTEFLVAFLGKEFMTSNKLLYPSETGYAKDYDHDVNAAPSNAFSIAFRLHSEIVGELQKFTENRAKNNSITLSDWFDKPSVCEHANNFDELGYGLVTQAQSANDRFHTNDMLQFLFKIGDFGSDMAAIDIQRNRDHGIATYPQILKALGIADITSFKDYEKVMQKEYVAILSLLYNSYEDVDLKLGGTLENNLPVAIIGPTFRAILADQFKRLRVGDRCFYENGQGRCAFTLDQLNEIRKSTVAQFLCENPGFKTIQPEALKRISKTNPLKSCSEIHKFDPRPWKESV